MPAAIPATRRARAAQALREGGSYAEAAREAKVSRRSVISWSKEPAFQALVRAERIRTLDAAHEPEVSEEPGSPSRAVVDAPSRRIIDVDLDPLADPSITSNRDLDSGKPGSFTPEVAASVVQVEIRPAGITVPLTYNGLLACQRDPAKLDTFIRAATSFRDFLEVWRFTGQERPLGQLLWPAQEQLIDALTEHPFLFCLKARKLGETTCAVGYDAWVLRFRDPGTRVHLFSRRDDAAVELLRAIEYGFDRMPEWLQLPLIRKTGHEVLYAARLDDPSHAKAYPADQDTAREATCSHAHVDELAAMGDPERVWQAVQPSIAPGGSCTILTTSQGPENWASIYYRRCQAGDGTHVPIFIGALERPDRDQAWLRAMQKKLGRSHMQMEFPLNVDEALAGTGDRVFRAEDLDAASEYCRPASHAVRGRKYAIAWDIGSRQDASVGIVLDITESPMHDVAHYVRLVNADDPHILRAIERTHALYPGALTTIEENSIGAAVLDSLNIPSHQVQGFTTTKASKERIISQLQIAFEQQQMKYDARAFEQLDRELRGYVQPDNFVTQDSVVALAIALESASKAHSRLGRIVGIIQV